MKRIIQRVAAVIVGIGFGAAALAGLETVTHISDLNTSWPLGSDLASTSAPHIRNIKTALKTDFPNITGPVTVTQAQLNAVGASGITGFANPTGTAGLTAVNGSAVTAMRSDGAPAISLSIAPTWTAVHKFSTSAGAGTESIRLDNSAGDARFGLYSAGTEYGILQATTNSLNLSTAGASTTLKLSVNAGTIATIAASGALTLAAPSGNNALVTSTGAYSFGNTTDNPTYSFLGTGLTTFNGPAKSLGEVSNPSSATTATWIGARSGLAGIHLVTSTGGVDSKIWRQYADVSAYKFETVNDAYNAASAWLNVTRSGNTVASLSFGNATDNPTFNVLGTGLATFNGSAAVVGGMVMGAPTGGNQGAGTLNAGNLYVNGVAVTTGGATTTTGTFTGTFTGFTAGVTATCTWTKTGNTVTLFIPATANGTSNATTFNMTGLPAAIQPATLTQGVAASGNVVNNGVIASLPTAVFQAASGTVPFHTAGGPSNWTNTGTKGFSSVGTSFTYSVQ